MLFSQVDIQVEKIYITINFVLYKMMPSFTDNKDLGSSAQVSKDPGKILCVF